MFDLVHRWEQVQERRLLENCTSQKVEIMMVIFESSRCIFWSLGSIVLTCVILGKVLSLSVPLFPSLKVNESNIICSV